MSASSEISVIIPLHNGASFIIDTLDSLAAQVLPPAEVIVVDDESEDNGPDLARRHPLRPRVIAQRRAGVAAARNRGAFAAETSYIAFLDQDDLWLPTRCKQLTRFLETSPGLPALVTNEQSFYLARDLAALEALEEGLHRNASYAAVRDIPSLLSAAYAPEKDPVVMRYITTRDLLTGTTTVTTSYVLRRETFFVAGGCAPFARSLDDYWMLLNISRLTDIPMLDERSVLYRIHPSSTTLQTSWPMPLLTSLAAARFGGNLVPADRSRASSHVPPLAPFWLHQLFSLAAAGGRGFLDAIALTHLLSVTPREQAFITWSLIKRATKTSVVRAGSRARRQSDRGRNASVASG